MKKKQLLWLDDDHLIDRFQFELEVIAEDFDWLPCKATSLMEAIELLSKQPFDAMILDQQFPKDPIDDEEMPIYSPEDQDIWMGCILLYWLRGKIENIPQSPAEISKTLKAIEPKPHHRNHKIPVIIMSVANEKLISNALTQASDIDKEIKIYGKPVDLNTVERFLKGIKVNGK